MLRGMWKICNRLMLVILCGVHVISDAIMTCVIVCVYRRVLCVEDSSLWLETEGAIEWLAGYATTHPVLLPFPPTLPLAPAASSQEEKDGGHTDSKDSGVDQRDGPVDGNKKDIEGDSQGEDGDGSEGEEEGQKTVMSVDDVTQMYVNMYQTAIDMVVAGI